MMSTGRRRSRKEMWAEKNRRRRMKDEAREKRKKE
jgi:hypothetical protein